MTEKKNSFGRAVAATAKKLSDFQKRPANEGALIEKVNPGEIECVKQIRSQDNPGFSDESLRELADDILVNGQIEPCVIRPHPNPESGFKYLMVAGERRYRACIIAGVLVEVTVKDLTDAQAKRIQRSENVHSENLTQLELALALQEDKDRLGTLEKVAAEWSKGINWVAERLSYLVNVTKEGAGREAVARGITADISTVNDISRLDKLDPQAAADLLERAEGNEDLNLRSAPHCATPKPSAYITADPRKDPKKAHRGTRPSKPCSMTSWANCARQTLCFQHRWKRSPRKTPTSRPSWRKPVRSWPSDGKALNDRPAS
uniref:ParB-like N-terminal domain-containing protein n=3 Tax=Gammaproteobacteria TaxID=1236 RepID=A0A7R7TQU8_PSEAI|nr:ParB/RepB/Spo0J family partition protein [Pseudomonas aeruginosa]BCQ06443.1 hypothetical protein [Pseudomonas aeruginosa]